MLQDKRVRIGGGIGLALLLFLLFFLFNQNPHKDKPLLQLLIEYRAELEAPGITIAEAAQNLRTPQAAYEFVKDHTAYSAYFGRRQSPEAMLRTRVGNSADRAMLLGAIIEKMGWKVSYRQTTNVRIPGVSGTFKKPESQVLKEIYSRIGYDEKKAATENTAEFASLIEDIKKMHSSAAEARQAVNKFWRNNYASNTELHARPDTLRVYITAKKKGEESLYFDPTYPSLKLDKGSLTYRNKKIIENEVELWIKKADGTDQQLLGWNGKMAGKDMSLHFYPTADTEKVLDGPPRPDQVPFWTPALIADGKLITGKPFSVKGESPGISSAPPDPSILAREFMKSSDVTEIKITKIDTAAFPRINVHLDLESTKKGVFAPQSFILEDNGKQMKTSVNTLEQSGGAVSILSDVSGSMKTIGAFEIAKEAVIKLSENLSPKMDVGLISFAGKPRTDVAISTLGDGSKIKAAVGKFKDRYNTGIYKALSAAAKDPKLKGGTIVLLTDGEDTEGGSEKSVIAKLTKQNIKVVAIGLGEKADHSLLKRVSKATNGLYLKVINIASLDIVYDRIGQILTSNTVLTYIVDEKDFLTPEDAQLQEEINQKVQAAAAATLAAQTQSSTQTQTGVPGQAEGTSPQTPVERASPTAPNAAEVHSGTIPWPWAVKSGTIPWPWISKSGTIPWPWARTLAVKLRGSDLVAGNFYKQPQQAQKAKPKLYFKVRTGRKKPAIIVRDLIHLNTSQAAWALTGQINLFFDFGTYPGTVLSSAYISKWIVTLMQEADDEEGLKKEAEAGRIAWEHISLINGYRTYVRLGAKTKGWPSPGMNIYMTRKINAPEGDKLKSKTVFDVVYRWVRAYGTADDSQSMNYDLASTLAEGYLLKGENAVDALLEHKDTLQGTKGNATPPEYWSDQLKGQQQNFNDKHDWIITSKNAPDWFWVAHANTYFRFNGYYLGGGVLAKGANLEEIAATFDKIDKMLALYGKVAGKAGGLSGATGLLFKGFTELKREENKLWCYSTLMMAQVSDAMEDENATLNHSVAEARGKAGKLCKTTSEDFAKNTAKAIGKKIAKSVAKDWIKNEMKDNLGDLGAAFGNVWTAAEIGSGAYDLATAGRPSSSPVTPAFHRSIRSYVQAKQ